LKDCGRGDERVRLWPFEGSEVLPNLLRRPCSSCVGQATALSAPVGRKDHYVVLQHANAMQLSKAKM
jgi:hypothetical protein